MYEHAKSKINIIFKTRMFQKCGPLSISNFVMGARIAVLLCTETTQKIYRGGAKVDFLSRSRYYNKNYGYPRTRHEGYFFSEMVDNYEFYHLKFTLSVSFIEFRGYFRDLQSVYYV